MSRQVQNNSAGGENSEIARSKMTADMPKRTVADEKKKTILAAIDVRVLVPIADGSEEIETACITDTLSRFGADVVVATCMPQVGEKVDLVCKMSRGVKMVADKTIKEAAADEYDAIVLPGGILGARNMRQNAALIRLLQNQRDGRKLYGGIGAAPAIILASSGLLGPGATCYPARVLRDKMERPGNGAVIVQDSGTLVTSQGPGTSLNFALCVGELLFDKLKAAAVAKELLVERDESLHDDGQDHFKHGSDLSSPELTYKSNHESETRKRKHSSRHDGLLHPSVATGRGISQRILFDEIVWPALERRKWEIDRGPMSKDRFYLRPGVSRFMKQARKNVDFFDNIDDVLIFLQCQLSQEGDIKECLELLVVAHERGPDLVEFGKVKLLGTVTGWLINELKKNPFVPEVALFDYIILPQLQQLGWKVEQRKSKTFFLLPFTDLSGEPQCSQCCTEGVDYFTSRAEVMRYLITSDDWDNTTEGVELFQASIRVGKELYFDGHQVKDRCAKWFCDEAKRRCPRMTVSKEQHEKNEDKSNSNVGMVPTRKRKNTHFEVIIWPVLDKLGWHIERGGRPTDKYFCKPGVTRKAPYKHRVDFFDSKPQVMALLKSDKNWSSKAEIKDCLDRFEKSMASS